MGEGVGRSQSLLSVPAGWCRWFDVGADENGKPFMYKANSCGACGRWYKENVWVCEVSSNCRVWRVFCLVWFVSPPESLAVVSFQ